MLEVLDPEQNVAFNDHYLDLDYDLSEVLLHHHGQHAPQHPASSCRTGWRSSGCPGYTELEKLNIAKQFLIKKQIEQNGLTDVNITFSDKAILTIIRNYTQRGGRPESGAGDLFHLQESGQGGVEEGQRDQDQRHGQLDSQVPRRDSGTVSARREDPDQIGVTTGLAWTDVGGELLQTEVAIMPGKGKLVLTGKLGEVMQESAQAAFSYVRSRATAAQASGQVLREHRYPHPRP